MNVGTRPADRLGSVAAVAGIILVALGILLQESYGAGIGGTIRAVGGVLVLGGLAVIALWEPRRRALLAGASKRVAAGYMRRSAGWRWPDRWGLAGVAVGLALLVPALVMQVLFGGVLGAIVISPGIVLFWGGVALLIYGRFHGGRFHRRRAGPAPRSPRATGRGRDGGRSQR